MKEDKPWLLQWQDAPPGIALLTFSTPSLLPRGLNEDIVLQVIVQKKRLLCEFRVVSLLGDVKLLDIWIKQFEEVLAWEAFDSALMHYLS